MNNRKRARIKLLVKEYASLPSPSVGEYRTYSDKIDSVRHDIYANLVLGVPWESALIWKKVVRRRREGQDA